MVALDHSNMARMLQAENARSTPQPHMDVHMQDPNHIIMHQQVPHDQTHYYNNTNNPQAMNFDTQQHLAYSFPPQPHQLQAEMAAVPPHTIMHVVDVDTKKPRSSSGQANENELKDMLEKNKGRHLDEVANEVIANERTSSAEKTKQLFAMLWYAMPLANTCRRDANYQSGLPTT